MRIQKHNGTLVGDDTSGTISVNGTEGSYSVTDEIEITVTKKPSAIVPNLLVEAEIKKIFREESE